MRKLPLILALVLLLAVPARVAANGSGTLKGVVYNTSCYGPCAYPPSPPPRYTGDNLVVSVRTLPTRELVARIHPPDGRFRIRLSHGRYRVRARIGGGSHCWYGQRKRIRVDAGRITRVKLHVYNGCIV